MLNFNQASQVWAKAIEYLLSPPIGLNFRWWPGLSSMLGGLRPHEITLLCAPTGSGKTQLLAGITAQMLLDKVPTFVAPVETGDCDFLIRVVENLDKCFLNDGEPKPVEKIKAIHVKYEKFIFEHPLFISTHENRIEMSEMIMTLEYMHQTHGVKIALLDNLNFFLNVTSTQLEKAEMDNAIHEFVMAAKRLPMHIILVVHPRKTEKGRVESEFDIKGSSTAVQECSNVLLFNRPLQEDIEKERRYPTDREMIFRKIRKKGINVGKSTWLSFSSGRYQEVEFS